jgi:transposase-like protein
MARPSKLTPELQEKIVAAIRAGAWFSDACRAAGIKKSTAYEWIRRARGEDSRPATPEHVAFANAVDAAYAAAQGDTGDSRKSDLQVDTVDTQKGRCDESGRANRSYPELNGDVHGVCGPATSSRFQPDAAFSEGEGLRPYPRHDREVPKMELEVTLRLPAAGAVMEIPVRQRDFQPGVAGARILDTVHVADVGGLQSVELEAGLLRIELKTGERYQFPIAELLDGERDPILQLRETWAGTERAAYGGTLEKTRHHDVYLARLVGLRLVEPEPASTPERWSTRTNWADRTSPAT